MSFHGECIYTAMDLWEKVQRALEQSSRAYLGEEEKTTQRNMHKIALVDILREQSFNLCSELLMELLLLCLVSSYLVYLFIFPINQADFL